jgi:hypothetical protein
VTKQFRKATRIRRMAATSTSDQWDWRPQQRV